MKQVLPMRVVMLPMAATPDHDRNGMINAEDSDKATTDNPYAMWINDNNSIYAEPHFGDVPGSGVDNGDQHVNGVRDLVDFFPVVLDLRLVLATLPADKYEYFITHPTGAFNFIQMPDIQPDSQPQSTGAGSYLANSLIASDALRRPLKSTAGAGAKLGHPYLKAAAIGAGALLIEAKSATQTPPSLIIKKRKTGQLIANIPWALPVETDAVEAFYWRVNIRPAALGQATAAPTPPSNTKFRNSRKDRWFVFCHGYNVDFEAARGWNAETFKRLHQKGSNARFLGVSWEGNQGQLHPSIPFAGGFAPDYWRNAYNAFASSHALATLVNGLGGGGKIVAGHSLGNMIMSSAICDHGLSAEKYFMLNAAVPREAYFSDHTIGDRHLVRHPDWASFPARLWSSDWKNLFPSGDARQGLTWQGRFGNLAARTTPHNFYSTGEETLLKGNGSKPSTVFDVALEKRSAWIAQEMSKGHATKTFVTGLGAGNWSANGGWALSLDHYTQYRPDPLNPPGSTLPDTTAITDAQLRANPFFKPFTKLKAQGGGAVPDSANGIDLSGAQGSAHAANYSIRAWLLAHDVPAISNPAGSDAVSNIVGTDMNNGSFKGSGMGNWEHSDMKNEEINRVGKLYEKMVTLGELSK